MNLKELSGAVVIIGANLQQVAKAAAYVARAIAAATIETASYCAGLEMDELLPAIDATVAQEHMDIMATMAELAELVEGMPPQPPPKPPRPPKYLGPVNKANYNASRPPRRARSNCYKRHR